MLHVKGSSIGFPGSPALDPPAADPIDFRWMLSAVLQRRTSILLIVILCMAAAATYVVVRPGSYTAQTHLQLTNLKLTFSRDDALFAESLLDPTFLETQMQLMRSEKIAFGVVDNLRMASAAPTEPSMGLAGGLMGKLRGLLPASLPSETAQPRTDEGDARREAMKRLQRSFAVERAGMSNIVTLRYTAPDPTEAAQVVNEIARAYVEDQTNARVESAQSASIWLRERLRDVGPKTRVVARALPPTETSNPRGILLVGLAGFIGAGFGISLALLRQLFDRTVRTPEQVVSASGAECLGFVPRLKIRRLPWRIRRGAPAQGALPVVPILCWASQNPASSAASTLDHVKVAIDGALGRPEPRWIGISATFPGEGASMIAANLAHLIAARGERVLLVDCNCTNPSLSRTLTPGARTGLIGCLGDEEECLADAVKEDATDGMHFLPIGEPHPGGRIPTIWSSGMGRLLGSLAPSYDYILFDLPALITVAEVRAASRHLNGFILVVEWGRTNEEHLRIGIRSAGAFQDKLLGVVINRVGAPDLGRTGSPAAAFLKRGAVLGAARRRARRGLVR
jgi:Mrp family chromosome partitioning ATPase/capsular polysaccharide biosynthesis protein